VEGQNKGSGRDGAPSAGSRPSSPSVAWQLLVVTATLDSRLFSLEFLLHSLQAGDQFLGQILLRLGPE
jgi:hypothetical protein